LIKFCLADRFSDSFDKKIVSSVFFEPVSEVVEGQSLLDVDDSQKFKKSDGFLEFCLIKLLFE